MTAQVGASLLVAAALVVAPGPAGPRARLPQAGDAGRTTRDTCRACGVLAWPFGSRGVTGSQPLELAAAWELLAACLQAGLPMAVALRAVAARLAAPAGPALRRTAELLVLGASPAQAWQPALECPATARLARSAQRSGRGGGALADFLIRLAGQLRADAQEQSEARAQRAGVLIAAPLGLCFLPAFLAIGVAPVLIGLAGGLMSQW
jgi:pilus assembly protein TadC